MNERKVAWVGLGQIAQHHLAAVDHLPSIVPVAGCDPDPGARQAYADRFKTYKTVPELVRSHRPDVVIVASPTPTHAEICRGLLEAAAAPMILVEKPIATALGDLDTLGELARNKGVKLHGIYHAAHAPDVEWGRQVAAETGLEITAFEAGFFDPYAVVDPATRAAVYGDSWLDSGINALSVLARFLRLESAVVKKIPGLVSTYQAAVQAKAAGRNISGRIFTSWNCGGSSKVTRLQLGNGGVMLLDHQAGAGELFRDEEVVDAFGVDGRIERLTTHYINAFETLIVEGTSPLELDDRHLLELLLATHSPE